MAERSAIGRRQVLAGFAAAGAAVLAAGPGRAAPHPARFRAGDPEPLQSFPGFAEGFYRLGASVLYIDEKHAAWAPAGIDRSSLVSIAIEAADLPALLRALRKRHWAWAVEHAVLNRLSADRYLALDLLTTAITVDRTRPGSSATRLHHLMAALGGPRTTWGAVGTDGRAYAAPIGLA